MHDNMVVSGGVNTTRCNCQYAEIIITVCNVRVCNQPGFIEYDRGGITTFDIILMWLAVFMTCIVICNIIECCIKKNNKDSEHSNRPPLYQELDNKMYQQESEEETFQEETFIEHSE
jgi:hypothetical protein